MLFGVPDEITDMTRSSGMFWRVLGTYRVIGRGSGHPPATTWAEWAKKGTNQPLGGWCTPGRPK